jgi:hypothetical protein
LEAGWKDVSGERNNCRDTLKDHHLARLEVAERTERTALGHEVRLTGHPDRLQKSFSENA